MNVSIHFKNVRLKRLSIFASFRSRLAFSLTSRAGRVSRIHRLARRVICGFITLACRSGYFRHVKVHNRVFVVSSFRRFFYRRRGQPMGCAIGDVARFARLRVGRVGSAFLRLVDENLQHVRGLSSRLEIVRVLPEPL